jgi:5-methylcytosine-specific restriction endonuclease McrA
MKMTKREVMAVIEYLHSNEYLDGYIDDGCYKYILKVFEGIGDYEELNEDCRRVLFEFDILCSEQNGRRIAYPFNYDASVLKWKKDSFKESNICPICGEEMNNIQADPLEATIDHEPPLSKRFNDGEWEKSKAYRRESYNNTELMQVICRSCNSRKGGENYKRERLIMMNV